MAMIAAVTAAGLGCTAPAAEGAARRDVKAGESIQQAVDAAKPGDTIVIAPGTYRESVQVTVPDLTLTGAGESTVISPPATSGSQNACAKAGRGICVTGTAETKLTGVNIRSLTVQGFSKDGIWGIATDRMSVRGVVAQNNGQQGIGQEKSIRGDFQGNTSRNNGQGGIFLANTMAEEGGAIDTQGAVISDNHISGNRIGVGIRRARNLTIRANDITGNCGGVFIVGDEGVPRAGALTVADNVVTANNKYCAASSRLPFIQGTGILLTGAEDTTVTGNQVRNNTGASPMSGGVVLFPSVVGVANSRNAIRGNVMQGNGPADLADRDKGAGNTFAANTCKASEPTGKC
jgi:nitrous oxidase accessory protein NosD